MKRSKNADKYYMNEGMFIALWKYARPDFEPEVRYVGANNIFSEHGNTFSNFLNYLESVNVPLNEIGIYSDHDVTELHLPPSHAQLEHLEEKTKNKVLEAAGKIVKSNFGLQELKLVLPYTTVFLSGSYLMTDTLPADGRKLLALLDEYIQNFIDGELLIRKKNYYKFEIQKEKFIELLNSTKSLQKYGTNFVLSYPAKDSAVLFCHTLYALEYLGYLTIKGVWFSTVLEDVTYHANILVDEKLLNELVDSYQFDNPNSAVKEYDATKGTFILNNKQVIISKSSRTSDAALLMKSLMSIKIGKWGHKDEILEEWGYNFEDQARLPKNKIYDAKRKLNTSVALQTGVKDFIEGGVAKARINPKYRKS